VAVPFPTKTSSIFHQVKHSYRMRLQGKPRYSADDIVVTGLSCIRTYDTCKANAFAINYSKDGSPTVGNHVRNSPRLSLQQNPASLRC
jgi:hypothetical protein